MRGNAKSFVVLSFAVVLSAGCERMAADTKAGGRSATELDTAVTKLEEAVGKLENEVRGLEKALATAENSKGRWILWKTSEHNQFAVGLIPPKPLDGFSNKQACVEAAEDALVDVVKTGEGKQLSATSYQFDYRSLNDVVRIRVTFRCLPDTVEAAGAKVR